MTKIYICQLSFLENDIPTDTKKVKVIINFSIL